MPRLDRVDGTTCPWETVAVHLERSVDALGNAPTLVGQLRSAFAPTSGISPRLVKVPFDSPVGSGTLSLVQDASVVTDLGSGSPAACLLTELDFALEGSGRDVYLCCINRGILDDALIEASAGGHEPVRKLLEHGCLFIYTEFVALLPIGRGQFPFHLGCIGSDLDQGQSERQHRSPQHQCQRQRSAGT